MFCTVPTKRLSTPPLSLDNAFLWHYVSQENSNNFLAARATFLSFFPYKKKKWSTILTYLNFLSDASLWCYAIVHLMISLSLRVFFSKRGVRLTALPLGDRQNSPFLGIFLFDQLIAQGEGFKKFLKILKNLNIN
jgi:hypothetical protein